MGHNDLHDWLDMACSKALGDKKAYKRYKREKEKGRKRDRGGRVSPPYSNPNDYYGLPISGGVYSGQYQFVGVPNVSGIPPGVPIIPDILNVQGINNDPGLQNYQGRLQNGTRCGGRVYQGRPMRIGQSFQGSQSAPQLPSQGGVQHSSRSSYRSDHSQHGFQHGPQQPQPRSRHDPQPGSHLGSQHGPQQPGSPCPPESHYGSQHSQAGPHCPYPGSQQGAQQVSYPGSRKSSTREPPHGSQQSPDVATARVQTQHYQVGDMTRTYLEGYAESTKYENKKSKE